MDELLNRKYVQEVRSIRGLGHTTNGSLRNQPAELREEFAQRYENDKEQMVEAMDKMIGDVIGKELEESKEDKAKVNEDPCSYPST